MVTVESAYEAIKIAGAMRTFMMEMIEWVSEKKLEMKDANDCPIGSCGCRSCMHIRHIVQLAHKLEEEVAELSDHLEDVYMHKRLTETDAAAGSAVIYPDGDSRLDNSKGA